MLKALASILVNPLDKVIVLRDVQLEKVNEGRTLRPEPIDTFIRLEQPEKTDVPISIVPPPKETVVNLLLAKQLFPIEDTEEGSERESNPDPEKADSPIVDNPSVNGN